MSFTQQDKDQLIKTLESALKEARLMPVGRNCATCANYDFRDSPPSCRAAGCAPPPEVIEVGCDAYIYDHTQPPF